MCELSMRYIGFVAERDGPLINRVLGARQGRQRNHLHAAFQNLSFADGFVPHRLDRKPRGLQALIGDAAGRIDESPFRIDKQQVTLVFIAL